MDFLRGYKTYIISSLMILVGIVNVANGDGGALQGIMDNAVLLFGGGGFASLRQAVSG